MAGLVFDREHCPRVGKWSWAMQGMLQFLGVFDGGKIRQKDVCYMCDEKKQQDSNHVQINSAIEENGRCDVCKSLQWNSEGRVVIYDEKDIVTGPINHRFSRIAAVIVLLTIIGFMCHDLVFIFKILWGRGTEILHLVSYLTFWIPLLSVPGFCFTAHVCNIVNKDSISQWSGVFSPTFIARRLQFLSSKTSKSNERTLPSCTFLCLCLLWAFANAGLEFINYFVVKWKKPAYRDFDNFAHLGTTTISIFMFGCFCYLFHLLSDSLDCEYNQVIAFVMNHRGNVDLCRCRIVELFRDYKILHKAVCAWMILILSCATLGLTVHISWNYAVYTQLRNDDDATYHERYQKAWTNILIGSEKLMLLFLPLLSLGGYSIECSWKQFYHAICIFREEQYDEFWHKLSKMVIEMHPPYSSATVTMISCVVGWFIGLHLGNQNTNYSEVSSL